MSFIRKRFNQYRETQSDKAYARKEANKAAHAEYMKRYKEYYKREALKKARSRAKAEATKGGGGFGSWAQQVTERNIAFWSGQPVPKPKTKTAAKKTGGKTTTIRVVHVVEKQAKPKPQAKKKERDIMNYKDWL